ncbi:MAG: hypothetical protein ACXWHZ_03610 [Usitatibacter sp.]
MTTEATQQEASHEEEQSMDALFAEAAGTEAPVATEEGAEQPAADQPKQEETAKSEGDLDLPQNTVVKEATAAKASDATKDGEAKPAAEQPAASDWRASLSAEAKAEVERIEAEARRVAEVNAKLAHQARSDAGRVAALTKRTEELARRAKEVDSAKAQERKALTDKLKADFPEIAAALDARDAEANERIASTEQLAKQLAQDRKKAEMERAAAQVEAVHPKWLETIKTPAFGEWLGQQPQGVRALASSDEPGDAVTLLDAYRKAHPAPSSEAAQTEGQESSTSPGNKATPTAAEIKAKRAEQLTKSTGVATKTATRESTNTVPDDTEAAFNHFAAQKDKPGR